MVQIRAEMGKDQEAVKEIHTLAFGQENEARLVDDIRESEHFIPSLSLVADKNGEIVGHILFSRVFLETNEGSTEILSLAPMSVKPEYQNLGSAVNLWKKVYTLAGKQDFLSLWYLAIRNFIRDSALFLRVPKESDLLSLFPMRCLW
ncbi:MAG TPA: N-acetyltransferase [Bacillales bacterium]|nr:N-acetyltransferase [Bacillales bacterium]